MFHYFLPLGELITPHLFKVKMEPKKKKQEKQVKKEKELKNCHLKVRVTEAFRRQLTEYCDNYNMTISEFLRKACEQYLNIQEVKKNESAYN